ncbi:hypothetical protein ACMZOO_00825 [Catenovulum sp. SX2]|uniref:hypothetical protein n=1 Tax=Catenovulum sp. SX2 TaxID=3398614 RepID=UPI003F869AA6
MPSIKITGYENLKKVSMDKAFNSNTQIGLKASKSITDELLKNGTVTFDLKNATNITGLLQALKAANANVQFIE